MINLNKLSKKYGNNSVLEDINYTFPSKGLVCLLGPSGGGKSTLLNLIAGFDSDYSGEIKVGNRLINELSPHELCNYRRDNIGFVFQNYHLLRGYTVLENILLPCELNVLKEEDNKEKAIKLLKQFHIFEKKDEKIENLSGGQKQRVAIARALINDPSIILADEPTGALDRKTSTDIMNLFKEISKDKLVVVITHDIKICEFADEVIKIENKDIVGGKTLEGGHIDNVLVEKPKGRVNIFKRSLKNFKVNLMRYATVSLAIAIGIVSCMLSLSSKNIMYTSIEDFKEKNTAFNNGYIKGRDDGSLYNLLTEDQRIENVYYQYKLRNITLSLEDKVEVMEEKYPTAKAVESLSYGIMPREGKKEIALTPSISKKFTVNIKDLIGKNVKISIGDMTEILEISGIYNAGYDDFVLSSDIERLLYKDVKDEENYSITYDVKDFKDILGVSDMLKEKEIDSMNASEEVRALENTFNKLNKLFWALAILILGVGIFICCILLLKLQGSRYREVGLLAAIGFSKGAIRKMLIMENLLLAALSLLVTWVIIFIAYLVGSTLGFNIIISGAEILLATATTFVIIVGISGIMSYKLGEMEPSKALRM